MRLFSIILLLALPSGIARAADPRAQSTFTVTPANTGAQLVRTSLPLPRGFLREGQTFRVANKGTEFAAAVRLLSWHPITNAEPKSARRALVTFPFLFPTAEPVTFSLRPVVAETIAAPALAVTAAFRDERVTLTWKTGERVELKLLAPSRTSAEAPRLEVVEHNETYRWQRWHFPDPQWPRIIELRCDALGGAVLVAHLQRNLPENGRAPDFGWEATTQAASVSGHSSNAPVTVQGEPFRHNFAAGAAARFVLGKDGLAFYHPAAPLKRRGHITLAFPGPGQLLYRYFRCTADEAVPMQPTSWQRAEIVIAPSRLAPLSATLESPHTVVVAPARWRELSGVGSEPPIALPAELNAIVSYHRDAIVRSMAVGDDWGNVTGYADAAQHGGIFGMNRLNHCAAIFEEGWRSGDRRLLETGVLWCDNFYDQSIWWGEKERGGTRYNNVTAMNQTPPDRTYMWRSNGSVNFCTKGYEAFWLAWEQTGDPRMREALDAQIAYVAQHLHADRGECRNIGDVHDFTGLYHSTGENRYLGEALRLFRELRQKLSLGDLFDQGGKPLNPDPPFIEEDQRGSTVGFAKPYIIGYALAGLPELSPYALDEPKLRDVIRAVAHFLAESQDPIGGWRYPHPCSSTVFLSQAIEHAWQITQAARLLGPDEKLLDAIEATLRQRIHGWRATGQVFGTLAGWEITTGKVKAQKELYDLYQKPADRDMSRDYLEGRAGFGSSVPEGIVYFTDVLEYYLRHRPAARLLAEPPSDSPLGQVLSREKLERKKAQASAPGTNSSISPEALLRIFQSPGVVKNLPAFHERLAERMEFPLSWLHGGHADFDSWRRIARAKVMECLLTPPPTTPFAPVVIAEQDRGTYVARKLAFNLTGDSRVLAYLLVPKSAAPHPAVLLLHDHGAKFDIGKEKVIEPWGVPPAKLASAHQWVERYYGNRFIGDELARRGYVCLATDMLNWSDRGGGGYDGQGMLAANLLQFGTSFAGLIAHEDLRAAEFLATQPEVDPKRIAAMGLSVGGFRAWQLSALSDHIAVGVSVCWMSTRKGLLVPGNNQTTSQSAFTMIHPGLANFLDYPDVASIACPKPMMFLCGRQDDLFPVVTIEAAFAKMRHVWESQHAGAHLATRLYDAPHEFNTDMQADAWAWLQQWN